MVLAMATPGTRAQELTPEQRRFMGLPASGPLRTGVAPVVDPKFSKPEPSIPSRDPLAGPAQAVTADPAMTFKLVSNGGVSCCEWIAADGAITPATPQTFKDFVAGLGQGASTLQLRVTFNSPGGDFFAALALGREIRRDTRMWTAVGRTEALPDAGDGASKAYQVVEGVCLSACVLAFMGGKTRDYGPEGGASSRGLAIVSMAFDQPASVIGRPSAEAMATAGLPAGGMLRLALEGYAAEMGVDPAIAEMGETAGQPGGMHVFTPDEVDRLALATPLVPRTKWNLAVFRGGLALYGAGEDRWSSYKVSLKCLRQEHGGLEYSIAVPVDLRTRSVAAAEDDYRGGIQSVEVTDSRGEATPARIAGVQVIPHQPLPTTVPRYLLLTTRLDAAQVDTVRRGGASIRFEVPHSLQGVLPEIALGAHQVTDAVGLLLRNCPSD
jgi:hypothetical protein